MRKKTLVVAIGDVGKNLLMGCLNDNKSISELADFLIVSFGHSVFPGTLPEIVLDGKMANGSNKKYAEMLCAENRDVLLSYAHMKSTVIIVAGSDVISIGAVNALSLIYKSESKITFSFIKEPLRAMKSLTYKSMEDYLAYARDKASFLNVFSNHFYSEGVWTAHECFAYTVRLLTNIIIDISILSGKDENKAIVGVGIEIFKKQIKNKTYVGFGTSFGENSAITSVRSALCSAVSNIKIVAPKHILLILRGDVSLLDISDAVTMLEEISDETTVIDFSVIYEESDNHRVDTLVLARGIEPQQYEICR